MKNLILKSSFHEKLKVLIIPMMLLTLGVGQMGATTITGGKVYYNDALTNFKSTHNYLACLQSNYFTTTEASNAYIDNTKLMKFSAPNHSGWSGEYGICFFTHTSTWNSQSNPYSTITTYSSHYTASCDYNLNNSNNYYLFTPSSSSNGCSLVGSWNSSRDNLFKQTYTIKAVVKKAGSNSYVDASASAGMPASSVSVTAYYLNGDASSTSNEKSLSGSTYSTTFYGCPGGKITLSQTAANGYTFDGYYISSSEITSPYYPTSASAITIEARYTEVSSTVSLVASPSGKGTFTVGGSAATSTSVGVTTTKSVTAVPISGYHFVSWSISGGASISSTSTNPTTVTGGGAGTAATLTATFEQDAVNYTITYGAGTSYTSYGSVSEGHSYASGSPQAAGTEISLTATPYTHYKLEGWYSDATCSSAIAGAGTTNPYEFTLGANTSVYAKFVQKTCTITLDRNGGTSGSESVTATHGSTLPSFTAHSRTGYTLTGYWTNTSGGTKIIDANGALVASTTYANASKQWNNDATTLTLHAQWTADTYDITYVDANNVATITSNPATGATDATIDFTVTLKPGYKSLSVTAVDAGSNTVTVTNPSSNNYRFTMPASDVTVTVTATALPIVYVLKTKHANSSLGDGATGLPSTATIWAWKASGSENFYTSASWPGPSASSKATTYTDDVIGDEWYCFIPDNTSQFDASTAYHVIMTSTNRILDTQSTFIENGSSHAAATHTGTIWVVPHGTDANTAYLYTYYPDEVATPYNTTYFAGDHGSINVFGTTITSGNSQTIATTKNRTLTATPASGYEFNRWITTGSVTVADATSATTTVSATAAGGTVTATYFESVNSGWYIKGNPAGDDWDTPTTLPLNRAYPGETNVYYRPVTLPANDQYFRFWCSNGGNHQYGASSGDLAVTKSTKYNLTKDGNNAFKYSAGGTVWFVVDASGTTKKCWLQDPQEFYAVNFGSSTGCNTLTAKDGDNNDLISGNTYLAGTALTFTQTAKDGYTFEEWNTAVDGSGSTLETGSSYSVASLSSDVNVYAIYTPNNYTVTINQQSGVTGHGANGTIDATKSVTFDAALPALSGTVPTAANGYAFMGFYTEPVGGGVKVINPDKSWVASAEDYTDASSHWIHADDVTLYAYYKNAEVTSMTFKNNGTVTSPAVFAPSTSKITVTAAISPTPVGDTHIEWRILHNNDNPITPQPSLGTGTTTNQFTVPETSGMYKVEATLRTGTTPGAGTVLHSTTNSFQVAGDHDVTVQYKCGDATIKASEIVTGRPLVWTEVTAPTIFGYTFSKWIPGDGVSIRDGSSEDTVGVSTNATIEIKAIYDGSLTAIYTQKSYIYFKNTLGWSSVYVNFYGEDYWGYNTSSEKGSGNKDVTNRNKAMSLVEGTTDIYYYDYGTAGITPTRYVSFTEDEQEDASNGYQWFWKAGDGENVVYPARRPDDLLDKATAIGFYAKTPMFVPLAGQDAVVKNNSGGGKANYYNAGYWTKYTPGTGYRLEIYYSDGETKIRDLAFTSTDELMPMKATANLEAGQTYKFQLKREGDVYYGNSGEMTYANHGQSTPWEMTNDGFTMCRITTNASGDYTFTLSYSGNSSTPPQYRLRMAVDYPIANGDYRVIYKHTGQTNWKASAIVPKVNNGKDTVSFFIRPEQTPYMKIQQASVNSSTGAITWSDYYSVPTETLEKLSGDKVYNACITMGASGGASVEKIEPYTGNYYIRVDCANSKWDNYRGDPDHLMTYSEYSIEHGGYSHYYCHWVQTDDRKNIKFTIANDYNPGLSDTLTRETVSGDWANIKYYVEDNGDIKRNANVRFMWNQSTNAISRAYVDGAQEDGSRFLVISSTDGKIKKSDGSALTDNEVTFKDNENWIYEANVKAQPLAAYKLISTWGTSNTIVQYFKGSATTSEQLIGGSGSGWYDIRLLYDFKTNRLVAAWVPSDANITTDNAINADVMFIREHQGDIAQLTFGDAGKISKITTAYGVMRFNKYTLANKDKSTHNPLGSPASVYERSLFWISFPFKVKLSEVFGFGTYGTHWAIQYYDGADRAARGHFQENGSFWKWMNRSTAYLEPNQGYLLAIDLDLLGESSNVWGPESKSSQIELYFPSYGTMPSITDANVSQTIPSHECTINWYESGKVPGPDTGDPRTSYNRTIFDSHWNVISVPTYVNTSSVAFENETWTTDIGPKFLYTWNADDNSITATKARGYTYHAMHAYMTQYCGGITWSAKSGSPASIVSRRTYAEEPKEIEFNLELLQNDKMLDRTYVVMSEDEDVSAGFKFGEDMTKEFNANKSAIYTFIPNEAAVAGNTLPMSDKTTVVPVGVDIKAEGEYVISLPDGTSGVGVTLIDNELHTRTNLALTDYAVTLPVGTYDERFVIEISPIEQIVTNVELINGENGDAALNGVSKKLIDGVLYIIKDGKVFDARGARIQ